MGERSADSKSGMDDINIPSFLLWADCEFTGLDLREGHKIIEIGALITDLALNEIDSYQRFIGYSWQTIEKLMNKNPWWDKRTADRRRMHEGLTDAPSVEEVDHSLASFIDEYFADSQPPLCGNTIGNDKKHIDDQLPETAGRLNYRVIDVSSFKIVAGWYRGIEYSGKTHQHYAMDDIRESIDEFRFLMTSLGIIDISQLAIEQSEKKSNKH